MAVTDGKVSRPIVLTEVAKLLRTNIRDLGRLCRCGNINIWAKYKPTKYNVLFGTGKSTTSEYWKANDGSCGINFSDYIYTSAKQFVEAIFGSNTEVKWEHVVPTGGATSPYRLSDFDGYNHKAVQPFGDIEDGTVVYIDQNSQAQIDLELTVSDDDEYNLKLSDFSLNGQNFSDCYLALAIRTSAKGWIMATSNETMGSSSLSISLSDVYSLGDSSGKTYDCVVCVATDEYNSIIGNEPSTIKYIGIPVAKKKIKFVNIYNVPTTPSGQQTAGNGGDKASVYILVCGEFTNAEKTEMRWWYECYNNSKSSKTLRFNAVLGDNGVDNGAPMNTGVIVVSLEAGKSVISDTYTKSGLTTGKNYWTWATAGDGSDAFGWVANPVEEGFAPEE